MVVLGLFGLVLLGAALVGMPLPLVGVAFAFLAVAVRGAFRSAEVPLGQVSDVRLVWRMRGETPFGRSVIFQPTMDWMATAYEHRVVRELEGLVARAKELADPGVRHP